MDAINRSIEQLLRSIEESDVYKDYKRQEENLNVDPELKARVDQFRADNFRLQQQGDSSTLLQIMEQLNRESAQLRRIPEVNAYLDAELALCRLMQTVVKNLTTGLDMHVPEL